MAVSPICSCFCKSPDSKDVLTDFSPGKSLDKLTVLVGFRIFRILPRSKCFQEGGHTRFDLGDGAESPAAKCSSRTAQRTMLRFCERFGHLRCVSQLRVKNEERIRHLRRENTALSDTGDVHVRLLGGKDVAGAVTQNDLLDGGDGDDALWGDYPGYTPTPGDDWLQGGAGNDTLFGGPGDRMLGGSGDDILDGEAGDDISHGATGRDDLRGGDGADTLSAGPVTIT